MGNVPPLHDSVVVEEETLDPRQVREVVHLPDFVVREVDGVELATTLYKTCFYLSPMVGRIS